MHSLVNSLILSFADYSIILNMEGDLVFDIHLLSFLKLRIAPISFPIFIPCRVRAKIQIVELCKREAEDACHAGDTQEGVDLPFL